VPSGSAAADARLRLLLPGSRALCSDYPLSGSGVLCSDHPLSGSGTIFPVQQSTVFTRFAVGLFSFIFSWLRTPFSLY